MGASASSARDGPAGGPVPRLPRLAPKANQETEEDRIAAAIQRFEARLASLEIKVDRVVSPRGISAPDEVRPADLVPGSSSSAPFETVSEPNEWDARQQADALDQPQQTPAALRRLRHPDFKPPVRLADNKWQHKSPGRRGRRCGARNTVANRAVAREHHGSDSTDVIDAADRALAAFTCLESEKHKRTGRRGRGGRSGRGGRGGNRDLGGRGMGGRGRAGGRGRTDAGNRRGHNGWPASVHDRYSKAVRDLAELQDSDDITAEQMLRGLDYWRVDSSTAHSDIEPLHRELFGRPLEEQEAVERRPAEEVLHPSGRIGPYANAGAPTHPPPYDGGAASAVSGRWTTKPVKPDVLSARSGGGQRQHNQQIVDNVPVRDLGGGQMQLDLTQSARHYKQAPVAASQLNRGMRKPLPPKHHPRQVGGDLHRSRRLNDDGQTTDPPA